MSDTDDASTRPTNDGSSTRRGSVTSTAESVEPPKPVSYIAYQLIVFVIIYLSYCLALYTRKGFVYLLPYAVIDRLFSSSDIDMILLGQQIAYMFGKVLFGFAVDHIGATKLLGIGLALAGFSTSVFPDVADPAVLVLVSAVIGLSHACIWPAIVKIMRAWYPYQQFGLAFNLMFTSANFIGLCGPTFAATMTESLGWRLSLTFPALLMMVISPIAFLSFKDDPSDVGYQDSKTTNQHLKGHYSDLLASDFFLIHMAIYVLLFTIKAAIETYGEGFLQEVKGVNEEELSILMLLLEVGGIAGSVSWGLITDNMQMKKYYRDAKKSIRIVMAAGSITGLVIFFYLFTFIIDADTAINHIRMIMFMFGFFLYATIMLLYLNAIAFAHIHFAGFAYSLMCCCANAGTFVGSVVIDWVAIESSWTWREVFGILILMSLCSFFLLTTYKEQENTFFIETTGVRVSDTDLSKKDKKGGEESKDSSTKDTKESGESGEGGESGEASES